MQVHSKGMLPSAWSLLLNSLNLIPCPTLSLGTPTIIVGLVVVCMLEMIVWQSSAKVMKTLREALMEFGHTI